MRRFLIEYVQSGEIKAEVICAATSTRACKVLADKLRKRGRPVMLQVSRISEVRL